MSARHHSATQSNTHDEIWLLLPWLASGRLPEAMRVRAERHVQRCPTCQGQLSFERQLCAALATPERISYAPGPSLAKLLRRIDAEEARPPRAPRMTTHRVGHLWRPPGFGLAAALLVAGTLAGAWVHRGLPLPDLGALPIRPPAPPSAALGAGPSRPAAALARTAAQASAPSPAAVLYISFARELTIDEMSAMLQRLGAQVVAGPGEQGIFGVTPVGTSAADAMQRVQQLATELRGDPRVRWVEHLDAPGARELNPFRP